MYLFLDTETGGLDPVEHSLLTAHFALVEPDSLDVVDELSLAVRPYDGIYRVSAGALAINKIDIAAHWQNALPVEEAAARLREFLGADAEYHRLNAEPLVPVGHNVSFDISFVRQQLLPDWGTLVSYRTIDLQSVTRFLVDAGLMPKVNGLAGAAAFFGLDISGHHDAAFDTRLTIEVFRKVRELVAVPSVA